MGKIFSIILLNSFSCSTANCERILRESKELDPSSLLSVYQIEIYNNHEQTLINNVEYAVFNEEKQRLDLSVCENEKITINYQLNTTMINMSKVNYFSDLGIDVFVVDGLAKIDLAFVDALRHGEFPIDVFARDGEGGDLNEAARMV